jgi:methionine synthase II (cobalamin-independent)
MIESLSEAREALRRAPYWSAIVGSFPHVADIPRLCERLVAEIDIPAWPQLSRVSFRENMYVQFSSRLPGLVLDEASEKIAFDTSDEGSFMAAVEAFYEHVVADDVDWFALPPDYAAGFYELMDVLEGSEAQWIKGQVTGPVSMGLTITDQNLRASLYNDTIADVLVHNAVSIARWQVRRLKSVCTNVIISVDEPYMAQFGSAYISLSAAQVVTMLTEVIDAIHAEGALAGAHCCGNTDWSVLLQTPIDSLNFDAYGYVKNLALYSAELKSFLDRGGFLNWGVVPNDESIKGESVETITGRLRAGLERVAGRAQAHGIALSMEDLCAGCLVTTSCGLGPATVEVADRALDVLTELVPRLCAEEFSEA